MTIGMGFSCSDGIVILSDTQMSNGYMKFYESKVYAAPLEGSAGRCGVVLTFAGNPVLWKRFRDILDARLREKDHDPTPQVIEQNISEILSNLGNSVFNPRGEPDLYLLCGVVGEGQTPLLLRSQAETVHRVTDGFDIVGAGDSSLIRYLDKVLSLKNSTLTRALAKKIGTYVLLQAKAYVDGCGGDTEIFGISSHGGIENSSAWSANYENNFGMAEHAFRSLLNTALNPTATDSETKEAVIRLLNNIKDALR